MCSHVTSWEVVVCGIGTGAGVGCGVGVSRSAYLFWIIGSVSEGCRRGGVYLRRGTIAPDLKRYRADAEYHGAQTMSVVAVVAP